MTESSNETSVDKSAEATGRANRKLVTILGAMTVAMFGFGYALIPLYDVFCDITGLGGKTGRVTSESAAAMPVETNRFVTVEFVTNVGAELPWGFRPRVQKVSVRPGEETLVYFEAINNASYPITGHAVPSVAPNKMARYFNKTECFCFTQQALSPGEAKDMPVRFVVDPKLPSYVNVLTLAYTFFEAQEDIESAVLDSQRHDASRKSPAMALSFVDP